MADRSAFLPRTAKVTLALAVSISAVAWLLFELEMAIGVALGALVGFVNLWLLSKAIDAALARAAEHRPAPGRNWTLPGVFLLKWPFVLLALGLILWYMPARPEGVGIGLALSLIAAAVAAASTKTPEGPP